MSLNLLSGKKIKIAIIGLGYVGLPLAQAFSKQYDVVGVDIDESRIQELQNGFDRTFELDEKVLQEAIDNGLSFCSDIVDAKDATIYIVTVPTPIDASNKPDLSPLIEASRSVGSVLEKGNIVIYESTVYPGVTEDVCVPILEDSSGLVYNKDFFCGYSPERINPGDTKHTLTNILKVTSGSTPEVADFVDRLYGSIIEAGTHKCSSIKVAEASKVIENTQRDVNIALINEFALIFDTMDIDTKEVLDAAATKWNFIKLTPGLVGGHCIGVDPYYLTYKAQELGYKPNLILGARQINNGMSKYIAEKTVKYMIKYDKKIRDSKILILGLTFKENCPDIRNSKVFDIIEELYEYGCHVDVYDPWVDHNEVLKKHHINLIKSIEDIDDMYDAIIVAVAHDQFKILTYQDYEKISNSQPIIIDIKGIVERPTWRL